MIKRILNLLDAPFPYSDSGLGGRLKIIVGSGLFVTLFLVIFQPFGSHEWQNPNKILLLAGFGLVTSVCLAICLLLFPKVFNQYYNEEHWTTKREILNSITTILFISIGNYLYSLFTSGAGLRFSLDHFLFMVWATFLIGLFPSVFFALFRLQKYQKRYAHPPILNNPSDLKEEILQPPTLFKISGDGVNEEAEFAPNDFLIANSSGNYVEIFLKKNQGVEKKLIRATLSRLKSEIPDPVVRCHRSYLVNLNWVVKISGNAQGYRLHLNFGELSVPVGRNFSESVLAKL